MTDNKTRWLIVILPLVLVGASSCTKEQTVADTFIPKDANEAAAMGVWYAAKIEAEVKLEEAKARTETIILMNKFKMACAVGMVAAVAAIGIGLYLRIKIAYGLAAIGLIACGAGYGLANAEIVYGKYIAIAGSIFSLTVGGVVIFIVSKALLQVVKGNEWFKRGISGVELSGEKMASTVFLESQRGAQESTKEKPSVTEKVVDKIRSKL